MSEPCRHERDAVAVHGALGAAQLEVARLKAELAELRASLTPERRPTFHGHGFVEQAAERLVTPWVEIPDEVLSDEAIQMLRDRLMKVRADRAEDPS